MLQFYKDCDAVLRRHLDYHDKIDSSPIEPRNKPKFVTVCEEVLDKYDIEYFRAVHRKLKARGVIVLGVTREGGVFDELFHRNFVTAEGFLFCQTTSFIEEYDDAKKREEQQQEAHQAIIDSTKAAQVSAKSADYSFRLAVIVAIITVIPIGLSVWQFFDSRVKDEKINLLETKTASLESRLKSVTISSQSQESSQGKSRVPVRRQEARPVGKRGSPTK